MQKIQDPTDRLTKIFQQAACEVDVRLPENLWSAIVAKERRTIILKLWIFAMVAFGSIFLLIPALRALSMDVARSGFYEYFSLLWAGGSPILGYWKELMFSLAESLPAVNIILSLSLIFISLFSLRHFMRQINRNHMTKSAVLST